MKRVTNENLPPLTDDQIAQLDSVSGREPDILDIPEAPPENLRMARRLYRPLKQAISIRLDADLLEWLKQRSPHYQVDINDILRDRMVADQLR